MVQSWNNDDDLYIKYGPSKAVAGVAGEYVMDGSKRMIELRFDYSVLPAVASNDEILSDTVVIPAGAFIESVEIVAPFTAWDSAGDAMTFCLGTIDADDRSSNLDTDDLIVDATQTEMNTGGTNDAGWVGDGVGTAMSQNKLLTWEVNSAAATAGEAVIRIYYQMP
jgi:hypothetical protein